MIHPHHASSQLMENYPSSSQNPLIIALTLIVSQFSLVCLFFSHPTFNLLATPFGFFFKYTQNYTISNLRQHYLTDPKYHDISYGYCNIPLISPPDSTLATLYSVHNTEVKVILL